MKNQFYISIILSSFIFTLFSCNSEKAETESETKNINETIAEETVSKVLGTDVETSNISNAKDSSVEIELTMDGKALEFDNQEPVINIAAGKDDQVIVAIRFLKEEDGKQHSMQLGLGGKKEFLKLPLTANFKDKKVEQTVVPTFSMMTMTDTGMDMSIISKGTLKVVEFSDEKVILEIDAEGGKNTVETLEGKNLVPVKGTISFKNPVMTFIGIKKEEIFN